MAAAVVRDGREMLSSVVHGQDEVHRPYGGVVPELASRDHVRSVSAVVEAALAQAGLAAEDLSGIAVTAGPGLVGSLLVGLSFAKALAYRSGFRWSACTTWPGTSPPPSSPAPALAPPYLGLVVSGGHTALYRIAEAGRIALLGETRDDAVGEAFDKVAKLLGPSATRADRRWRARRQDGDPRRSPFRGRWSAQPGLDFSFSGLKTAVALEVDRRARAARSARSRWPTSPPRFEAAAVDVLVARARRALARGGLARRLAVVGGVAANRRLRAALESAARADGFHVIFPPPALCTDNAAMIAAAGARLLARGERHGLALNSFSRVPLGAALGSMPVRSERRRGPRRCSRGTGSRARRDLGQNFLVDDAWRRGSSTLAGVEPGDAVIEIGTGLGIADARARRARGPRGDDRDRRRAGARAARRAPAPGKRRAAPRRRARGRPRGRWRRWAGRGVVANLPYSVASPLLRASARSARACWRTGR